MANSLEIDEDLKTSESFKQEALASWTAFQETGEHLSGEEVRAWLNTWGADGEAELPQCHK